MKDVLVEKSVEPLLQYFDKLISLNKEEKDLVLRRFHPRLFRRRHYALQEGDIATQFISSYGVACACIRLDDKGNTHIIQFAADGIISEGESNLNESMLTDESKPVKK